MRFLQRLSAESKRSLTKRLAVSGERLALAASRYSLLALVGITLLLQPLTAFAATTAVSTYVEETLKRADVGVADSVAMPAAVDFVLYQFPWLNTLTGTFTALLDTRLRITEEQRDLLHNSACLRIDLFLIEAKIEEVRLKMREMYVAGNMRALWRLQILAYFLNSRYETVLRGARDPDVQDTAWYGRKGFENSFAESGPPMCPFSTDYLPPSVNGYGCDTSTMRAAYPKLLRSVTLVQQSTELVTSTQKEANALSSAEAANREFLRVQQELAAIQQEIDALLGRSTEFPDPPAPRTHRVKEGCPAPGEPAWPEGAVRWELRGSFAPSPEKDEGRILPAFFSLKRREEGARALPQALEQQENEGFLIPWIKWAMQRTYRGRTAKQGEGEAVSFIIGLDPMLQTRASMEPFTKAVQRLSGLAQHLAPPDSERGLRDFVRDYALYLRRSCIGRPCNQRLEKVLKIILTDSCFPYTNGDFMTTASDYETCRTEAGL